MNRGFRALIGGAALALTVVVPVDRVTADEVPANDDGGSKAVVESETGSYIVVMAADPLVATIAAEDLDSAAALAQGDALDTTHDAMPSDPRPPTTISRPSEPKCAPWSDRAASIAGPMAQDPTAGS